MARIDLALSLVFSTICILGLIGVFLCFRKAMRVAGSRDGDVKMFFWAVGAMICLIIAGVSAAYILLPILLHYS